MIVKNKSIYHNSQFNRDINGIIILDKPVGLSSNNVLQRVKQLFHAKKAGHTGSLDVLASGMLPICFGEATKFSQYLLESNKYYKATACLGIRTNTSDSEGEIIKVRSVLLTKEKLDKALESFHGEIYQIPSMFSALKYQRRPLYEYARKKIQVPQKSRLINIYEIRAINWDQKSINLSIHCSKGTYIRTIIDDLGEYLGCGAHTSYLRRISIAHFSEKHMVTLDELENISFRLSGVQETLKTLDALLLPMDSAIEYMPEIHLSLNIATLIRLGQTVVVDNIHLEEGRLVRMTAGKEKNFFGIGKISSPGFLKPKRLIK